MSVFKTKELSGLGLDWSVAKALGADPFIADDKVFVKKEWLGTKIQSVGLCEDVVFSPSSSHDQGGQLINNIGIDLRHYRQSKFLMLEVRHFDSKKCDEIRYCESFKREMVYRPRELSENNGKWYARNPSAGKFVQWVERECTSSESSGEKFERGDFVRGDTMLVAAMRWVVLDSLGYDVEVPKVVTEDQV